MSVRAFKELRAIEADPFRPLLSGESEDPVMWELRRKSGRCPYCGGTDIAETDFYSYGFDDEDVCAYAMECRTCEETWPI